MAMAPNSQAARVQAQPNVYTVLILIAALALAVALGIVLYNLMAGVGPDGGYGMGIGEVFSSPLSAAAGR